MEEFLFDIRKACEELKITKDIYLRITVSAIEQTTNDVARLREAFSANNMDEICVIAHRLKGDYANLRVTVLSEIATQLNVLVKGEYDSQMVYNLIERFSEAFQRYQQQIKSE